MALVVPVTLHAMVLRYLQLAMKGHYLVFLPVLKMPSPTIYLVTDVHRTSMSNCANPGADPANIKEVSSFRLRLVSFIIQEALSSLGRSTNEFCIQPRLSNWPLTQRCFEVESRLFWVWNYVHLAYAVPRRYSGFLIRLGLLQIQGLLCLVSTMTDEVDTRCQWKTSELSPRLFFF